MASRKLKIQALRAQLGLTQRDVASKMCVAVSTYSIWENNPGRMTVDRVNQLMSVLGVSSVDSIDVGFTEEVCETVEITS